MCGIIGLYGNMNTGNIQSRKNYLSDGIYITALRGKDSTGVAALPRTKGNIPRVYKRDLAGADFIEKPKFNKLLTNMHETQGFIGHCRSATYKEVSDLTAHPFQHKHITLVHNGHVNNGKEIAPNCKIDVDSAHIAHAMGESSAESVLPRLRGAFSLVWWDSRDNSLHFARNGERPMYLHYDKFKDVMYFASEYEMLFAAASRNNISLDKDVLETTIMKHYTFENPYKLLEYKAEVFTQAAVTSVVSYPPLGRHARDTWNPTSTTTSPSTTTPGPIASSTTIPGESQPEIKLPKGGYLTGPTHPTKDAMALTASSLVTENKPEILKKLLAENKLPPMGETIVIKPKARAPFIVYDPVSGKETLGDAGVITGIHGPTGITVKVPGTSVGDYHKALREGMIVRIRSVLVTPDASHRPVFIATLVKTEVPRSSKSDQDNAEPTLYPAKYPPQLVTEKVLTGLLAGGCGNCSSPLFVKDHKDIVWGGPYHDIPFCDTCGHNPLVLGLMGLGD